MNRKGFATMIVLIIGFVCMTTAIFSVETILLQSRLIGNRHDSIQAELLLEKEIHELMYESEDILGLIVEAVCKPGNPNLSEVTLPLEIENMEDESGEIIFGYCQGERLTYKVIVKGCKNGVTDLTTATGHIFNPLIDHCKDGLVTMDGMPLEESEGLADLLKDLGENFDVDNIPADFFVASDFLENNVEIRAKSSGYRSIEFVRDSSSTKYRFWNGRIVLFKAYDGFTRDVVKIEKDTSSLITGSLTGVIYLENGDIIMSEDVSFNGIIILGNGRLLKEGCADSFVNGKVVMNTHHKPDDGIVIGYHAELVRLMSRFLPGFISPTIDSIR